MILNKKQMSEEDIKLNYITPALQKGWKEHITMETKVKFTDGRINIKGNMVARSDPKYADYILYLNAATPIAIVEAKDNNHSISYGLQQAMEYAKMLDLPFAYSSNGDGFYEHDFLTGKERQISMDSFPDKEELEKRYHTELNGGNGISDNESIMENQPFYSSQTTYSPRYYQRIAVNRTLTAIAKGQKRILLVMATGTGKTYTAFQSVHRLLSSKLKKRVLYLADRNNLVDQSIEQDFSPLQKKIYKINFKDKECLTNIMSHEIVFALYQQMVGDNGEENFRKIPQGYFDVIIVDECHRGSAKEDSRWRKVLEYFDEAVQIGMTATPKESESISNIDYFGEPLYKYSLKQGIDDGFLAPFKVINITTNISDGWRPYKGQLDINGNEIEDRIYNNKDYDYNIIIEDRINQVADEITTYLKSTDRMQKTIVFCASELHADLMRNALCRMNADMVAENPDYCVRITGSDIYGRSKLKYFVAVTEKYPVIATTSELLSTGTDCKMTKLIVIDKNVEAMTTFKQMIGRGTRIREKDGKMYFTVMDFRNVTRHFTDPDWDGPIEQQEGFDPSKLPAKRTPYSDNPDDIIPVDPEKIGKPVVDKNGCHVKVINKTVSIYDVDGKLLKQEDIINYTKTNIKGEYASLSDFIRKWKGSEKKEIIEQSFAQMGIDIKTLKKDQNMEDVDDFDFICFVAYGKKPLTRAERANNVKKRDFFSKYSGDAKAVLEILLDKYMNQGITEVEDIKVLSLADFANYGKPAKIVKLFGGKSSYEQAIRELEENIYNENEVG